jgi:hypothetical protein
MAFNHDSFCYKIEVVRARGDYERVERTGPSSKGMCLVRFLANHPDIALNMQDGETRKFTDPRTGREFKITYYKLEL